MPENPSCALARIGAAAIVLALSACGLTAVAADESADTARASDANDSGAASRAVASGVDPAGACAAPNGPAAGITTQSAAVSALLGRWLLCSSDTDTPLGPGIAFDADGGWARLVPDGSGGFTRSVGVENQGSWTLSCIAQWPYPMDEACPGSSHAIVLLLQDAAGERTAAGCAGGPLSFEASPTRMVLVDGPGEWCSTQDSAEPTTLSLVRL